MTEWAFRVTVAGIGLTDEQLDALFEAGCDDAAFSLERAGTVFGFFDRERQRKRMPSCRRSTTFRVPTLTLGCCGSPKTMTGSPRVRSRRVLAGLGRALGNWSVATGDPGGFRLRSLATVSPTHCGAGPTLKHGSGVTIPLRFGNEGRRCHRTSWPSSTTGWTYESAVATPLMLRGARGWQQRFRLAPEHAGCLAECR